MDTAVTRRAGWIDAVLLVAGIGIFLGGGAVLALEPAWTDSPVGAGAALIAGGLALAITTIARRRRERRDEVVVDERVTAIGEKAGYRAFQVTFAVEGLLLAAVAFTTFDPPTSAVLGALFAITALGYLVGYVVVGRSM